MSQHSSQVTDNPLTKPLADIVIESWRFSKLFSRLLTRLDAGEETRYVNQQRYYLKKLEDNLDEAGLRLINLEGVQYDAGMAVSALNLADFDADDNLIVEQMVEPVIMGTEGLVRAGTVMLKRVDKK